MFSTQLIAILNITPDSFSDGGKSFSPEAALGTVGRYIEEGADAIDIGAESTRPGALPVTPAQEWSRLEPVLKALPQFAAKKICFSLDTRHAETAAKALGYGVGWINDVSGFSDPAMVEAVKASDCSLVVMHSLSVPADKNVVMPESEDAVQALIAFAGARIEALVKAGIDRERLIFDPGIGFGKTAAQSFAILHGIKRFSELGVPLMVGHSRKSFLGPPETRDHATLVVSQYLAEHGVNYLRVHEVEKHRRMLGTLKALHHE